MTIENIGEQNNEKIISAVNLLKATCKPLRIILFGSQARGDMNKDSDLDLMVVVDSIEDEYEETVRLYRILWDKKIYDTDIVLVSRDHFNYWKETTNHICNEAALDGKILYDQTAA